MTGLLLGRVAALFRYPVKSMAAEPLRDAEVSWHGLAGDRRWAFVRPDLASNGFPWLTLRQRNDLNAYHPHWVDPARPNASGVIVRTPSGAQLEITDPSLAAELGTGVRLMKLNRGTFDTFPLSLITTRTIATLSTLAGTALDVRRFRPNLLVEPFDSIPFPEDAWIGHTLAIGSTQIRIDKRDKRCVVVNIDPATGHRTPEVLRAIATHNEAHLGVYATPTQPGHICVDDPVTLTPRRGCRR